MLMPLNWVSLFESVPAVPAVKTAPAGALTIDGVIVIPVFGNLLFL